MHCYQQHSFPIIRSVKTIIHGNFVQAAKFDTQLPYFYRAVSSDVTGCGIKLKRVAFVQVECVFSLFCCSKNKDSQTTTVR